MIFTAFILCVMVRVMVDMMFDVLFYHYRLNHIRLPQPGWELEVVKFVLTVTLVAPIISVVLR